MYYLFLCGRILLRVSSWSPDWASWHAIYPNNTHIITAIKHFMLADVGRSILRVVSTFIFVVNICKFWQILIDIFITVLHSKNWVPYPWFWMDLNQFSFEFCKEIWRICKCFLLGQTTWIGHNFKNSCKFAHFNEKNHQTKMNIYHQFLI